VQGVRHGHGHGGGGHERGRGPNGGADLLRVTKFSLLMEFFRGGCGGLVGGGVGAEALLGWRVLRFAAGGDGGALALLQGRDKSREMRAFFLLVSFRSTKKEEGKKKGAIFSNLSFRGDRETGVIHELDRAALAGFAAHGVHGGRVREVRTPLSPSVSDRRPRPENKLFCSSPFLFSIVTSRHTFPWGSLLMGG